MKKTLLFGMLLCAAVSSGQVINIPDPVFKARLLATGFPNWTAADVNGDNLAVDANMDGEIDEAEALAVYELNFSNSGSGGTINSVEGIHHFTNLRVLQLNSHDISELDVTMLTHLRVLYLKGNELTGDSLQIDGLAELEQLSIALNPIGNFSPSGLSSLMTLWANSSQLTALDLSLFPNLKHLQCHWNELTSLNAAAAPLLETLWCNGNQLSSLDLTGLQLTYLNCSNNPLSSLDVNEITTLTSLDCQNIGITTLDLTGMTNLIAFDCSNNPITSLDVSTLAALHEINCNNTLITELDLSAITNEDFWIRISNNPLLTSINLHNGVAYEVIYESWMENNPNLEFICIDEGEEQAFLDFFEQYDTVPPFMSTDCNYVPGQAYNLITGKLLYDIDLNGCEPDDLPLANVAVIISDGTNETTKFTNNQGEYSLYKGPGTYTITPVFENTPFSATPSVATVSFAGFDGTQSDNDFCVSNASLVADAHVFLYPLGNAAPGFDNGYKVVLKNNGSQWLNGTVTLTFDGSVLELVSANPGDYTASPGMLTWNYTDLHPYEIRYYEVFTNVNSPTETPAVNIGDILTLTAHVTPTENDINVEDNTFELEQEVVGSYDPNNIICLEGATEDVENIGEYLHYIINFENTGTAAATFVVLTQDINEEMYDVSSLVIMDNSHNMSASLTGNMLEFRFDNINLDPEEQGSVSFKIKSKANLTEGDEVMSNANIVFDYNFAIPTNEAVTVFETLMGTDPIAEPTIITVFPNPVKDVLTITSQSLIESFELYDVNGRLLQTGLMNDTQMTLTLANRASGIYFIKVTSEKGSKVEKIIKE